jgi:DNA-binding MarR family transcriptional regulator
MAKTVKPQRDRLPPRAKPRTLTDADYRQLADFRRALRSFLAFSKQAVSAAGLAPQQYQALLAIRARQDRDVTVGDLAEELYIRHNTAVELVDRLERTGLVAREALDGRRVALRLTDGAERVLGVLAEVHLAELRRNAPVITEILSEEAQAPAPRPVKRARA